jgi:hypothetical protein
VNPLKLCIAAEGGKDKPQLKIGKIQKDPQFLAIVEEVIFYLYNFFLFCNIQNTAYKGDSDRRRVPEAFLSRRICGAAHFLAYNCIRIVQEILSAKILP